MKGRLALGGAKPNLSCATAECRALQPNLRDCNGNAVQPDWPGLAIHPAIASGSVLTAAGSTGIHITIAVVQSEIPAMISSSVEKPPI